MAKTVQTIRVIHRVGSIEVVGVLTCCALLHFMCDLKAAQINMQCSLIWELMLYEFKLCYDSAEATKNISCTKGEGIVDHSTVTRWFINFGQVARTTMIRQD